MQNFAYGQDLEHKPAAVPTELAVRCGIMVMLKGGARSGGGGGGVWQRTSWAPTRPFAHEILATDRDA